MFYEMVGQAKPDDFGMEVVSRHVFDDSRTETSSHDAIFDGDDAATGSTHLLQDVFVDRLEEAHVIVPNCLSFLFQLANDFGNDITQRTEAEDCRVATFREQPNVHADSE